MHLPCMPAYNDIHRRGSKSVLSHTQGLNRGLTQLSFLQTERILALDTSYSTIIILFSRMIFVY